MSKIIHVCIAGLELGDRYHTQPAHRPCYEKSEVVHWRPDEICPVQQSRRGKKHNMVSECPTVRGR